MPRSPGIKSGESCGNAQLAVVKIDGAAVEDAGIRTAYETSV